MKRGIFQGESFSPLLFFLELIALNNILNKQGGVYEVKENNKFSHLSFMDDLKLFSRDKTELQQELTIVKIFSDCIRKDFALDKCATEIYKSGK